MTSSRSERDVARWYDEKTADLLRKYGPGPRVHYHTGIACRPCLGGSPEQLRGQLTSAQERLLELAAAVWIAPQNLGGDVLDVGCGLGGGAIYWAARYGARVVALTNVPSHATLISGFARDAGVKARVHVVVGDACTSPTGRHFDAAVAIESSCYLPRRRWMTHVHGILRPGGYLYISDILAAHERVRADFDADWLTRIGTVAEYGAAARAAGFDLVSSVDVTTVTRDYWALSIAYHQAISTAGCPGAARSIARHTRLLDAWDDGSLRCCMFAFRRR